MKGGIYEMRLTKTWKAISISSTVNLSWIFEPKCQLAERHIGLCDKANGPTQAERHSKRLLIKDSFDKIKTSS